MAEHRLFVGGFPTQICSALPMLAVEVSVMSTSASTARRQTISQGDTEWLHRLLADLRQGEAPHPSPQAVARIRGRLVAAMKTPVKVAA
jgi:hypothetical protein